MLEREMKANSKSFSIWITIILLIFLVVFLVYPMILTGENIKLLDEMMTAFPEEMLKAFNMDLSSMESVYGWLKSEGFVMILLIVGCYAGILGSNILLKEENDKTIEYLNSLPISRKKIVIEKFSVGISYILLMIIFLGLFNYVGLALSGEFDQKQYLLLSITPIFSSIVIFSICMFLSTFTHKTKKMLGFSLGIVFISYILHMLSTISTNVEFLKYFSVFTLADIRNVIQDITLNPIIILTSIVLSFLFLILTLINYNQKDLI